MRFFRLLSILGRNSYIWLIAASLGTMIGVPAASLMLFNVAALVLYNTANYFFQVGNIFNIITIRKIPLYLATYFLVGAIAPALGFSAAAIVFMNVTMPFVTEGLIAIAGLPLVAARIILNRNAAPPGQQRVPQPENAVIPGNRQDLAPQENQALEQIGATANVDQLIRFGLQAIRDNRPNVANATIDRLTRLDGAQGVVSQNNILLRAAAHFGRADIVRHLLTKAPVRRHADDLNNEALREACHGGHTAIVQQLIAQPRVLQNITFNNNEALRIAQDQEHFDIILALIGITEVADYVMPARAVLNITPRNQAQYTPPAQINVGHHYIRVPFNELFRDYNRIENLFNNRPQFNDQDQNFNRVIQDEGAMVPLNQRQQNALERLTRQYRPTMVHRTRDAIFEEIRQATITQYNNEPATHWGAALPIDYSVMNWLANNEPYYKHAAHGAYRYLFLRPNPWIAPMAGNTVRVGNGYAAAINEQDKDYIAYMWLAANDPEQAIPEGFTREALRNEFFAAIRDLARGHNLDATRLNQNGVLEHYDDMEGDKPTCGFGVTQRVTQFYMVFLNDDPDTRPLSADIIFNKFKEEMVNPSAQAACIYNKLAAMDKATLAKIEQALDNLCVNNLGDFGALDDDEKDLLNRLKLTEQEITIFVDACKIYYTAQRITHRGEQVRYQEKLFNTYEELIRHLGEVAVSQFYDDIKRHIKTLKGDTKKKKKSDGNTETGKNKGKVLKFSGSTKTHRNHKGSSADKENNDESVTNESAPNKKKRRSIIK